MGTHYVGKRVPRVDALDKVTGQAVYSVDVELPGMLYGSVLRSPLAHAKIVEIDTSAAWTVPGVRAVVTGEDFPFTFGHMIKDQPFLSIRKVRYVGDTGGLPATGPVFALEGRGVGGGGEVPIAAGQFEVVVNVQAIFDINQ